VLVQLPVLLRPGLQRQRLLLEQLVPLLRLHVLERLRLLLGLLQHLGPLHLKRQAAAAITRVSARR
jgi:hypothetical protein